MKTLTGFVSLVFCLFAMSCHSPEGAVQQVTDDEKKQAELFMAGVNPKTKSLRIPLSPEHRPHFISYMQKMQPEASEDQFLEMHETIKSLFKDIDDKDQQTTYQFDIYSLSATMLKNYVIPYKRDDLAPFYLERLSTFDHHLEWNIIYAGLAMAARELEAERYHPLENRFVQTAGTSIQKMEHDMIEFPSDKDRISSNLLEAKSVYAMLVQKE